MLSSDDRRRRRVTVRLFIFSLSLFCAHGPKGEHGALFALSLSLSLSLSLFRRRPTAFYFHLCVSVNLPLLNLLHLSSTDIFYPSIFSMSVELGTANNRRPTVDRVFFFISRC